jgi:hypothetical protein
MLGSVLTLLSPFVANASPVLFSNLSSAIFDSDVTINYQGSVESNAGAFVPSANDEMSGVEVKVNADPNFPSTNGLFNLFLYSDNGGTPGSAIETLGTNVLAPDLPPGNWSVLPIFGFTPIALTQGTTYWIVMTPATTSTLVYWAANGVPHASSYFSVTADGSGPWLSLLGASDDSVQFEIDGVAVPEPSALGMVATAAVLLALKLRRNFGRCCPHN